MTMKMTMMNQNKRVYLKENPEPCISGILSNIQIENTPLDIILNLDSFDMGIRGVFTPEGIHVESISIINFRNGDAS